MARIIAMRLINDKVGLDNKCITIYTNGEVEGLEGFVVINYFPRMVLEAQQKLDEAVEKLKELSKVLVDAV